ncbi:hypothetical protein I551_5470 [Mycobacterium ulcerans str. Harvey]|uniref:ESX-1 secretion-associated protein EspB PE domain-containing protein n=1 Tax=Mycobacterium ulcerans str. Harvey TaxID=1299332 RepID=A0ABN0QTL1_MYCUL|nr:hypothetical protein I551_5470 [Mycobacterium ulcerans str. Harvey]
MVPEELMGRASELESLIAAPTASLKALCALPMVVNATADLVFSANAMLTYIDAGNKARQQLSDALREAAKSYVGTDEQVEQALNPGAARCRRWRGAVCWVRTPSVLELVLAGCVLVLLLPEHGAPGSPLLPGPHGGRAHRRA